MPTKREIERLNRQVSTLQSLGFTREECDQLRRISMTLHSWHEKECGINDGCIERDENTGKTYWLNSHTMRRYPIRDMETGAINRLKSIISRVNVQRAGKVDPLNSYIQTDPR